MPENPNMTRHDDDPNAPSRLQAARNENRRRTIFIAVICSGIVALAVSRASEVEGNNNQTNDSRVNCQRFQDDLHDRYAYLNDQADPVLGNPKAKPPIPKADFSVPPYSKFSDFKAVIISQAVNNRRRAEATAKRFEDCKKTFPKQTYFGL